MASVNKTIVLGNLGQEPEVRYMPNGMAVCNLSVATSRHWKNKDSGERQEETEWHRVVMYDRLAEIAGEYCKKGKPVYVEGRLKTRMWEKDGTKHYTTEIIAESMQLLGGREDGGNGGGDSGGGYSRERGSSGGERSSGRQQAAAQRPAPRQSSSGGGSARGKTGTGFDDMDDDIPFATACASFDMVPSLARRVRRVA